MTEAEALALAGDLAARGEGHTRPNPPVGAVILQGGEVIGRGWHKRCGGPHAEANAIADARRHHPERLRGATICVTLEPCSKPGRVGACTDAIAAAGIARVVYAEPDPNPANRGKAKRALARHGIACERFRANDAALAARFADLIRPFARHVLTGRPYVTVKIAMSLDGKICDETGNAKWISSARARRETGRLRERVDAIMVGAETVRRDDPCLLSHGRRNDDLVRVVISRSGRLPKTSRVLTDGRNPTLVYSDPQAALEDLGRRGFLHVLCEGGLELARSLAARGLIDEWICVLAPKVIGHAPLDAAFFPSRIRLLADE